MTVNFKRITFMLLFAQKEKTMKNIYFYCVIALFIFLSACQSSDEKRTCEILEKMNSCWDGISTLDTEAIQKASACESKLEIEFTALETNPLEAEKTRVQRTQQLSAQCIESSTVDTAKQCVDTYFQAMKDIFECS